MSRLTIVFLVLLLAAQWRDFRSMWLLDVSRVRFASVVLKPGLLDQFSQSKAEENMRWLYAAQGASRNGSRVYFALGQLSLYLHKTDMAVDSFQHATALDARDLVAWGYLGNLYEERGETSRAEQAWQKAGLIHSKTVEYWWKGVRLEQSGKSEEAKRAFRIIMDIAPDFVDAYYGYVSACWGQSHQSEPDCIEVADRLVTIDQSNSARRVFEEGRLALLNGQTEAAIAAFRTSLSIDPSYCLAHQFLIASLQQAGRSSEASEAMRRKIPGCGE
jgi:tetratricopeptide (TPR) repeat protein